MTDIQLVIRIPEEAYNLLKTSGVDWLGAEHILDAVSKGIPLPEPHGDLISRSDALARMQEYHDDCAQTSEYIRLGFETAMEVVKDAETIIPATKEKQSHNLTVLVVGDGRLSIHEQVKEILKQTATKEGDGE